MKNLVVSIFLAFAVFVGGCKRVDLVEGPDQTPISGGIVLKAFAPNGDPLSIGDTIVVERGVVVNYYAYATSGLVIRSWQWTFIDDGSTTAGQSARHTYYLNPVSITSVRVVATDSAGVNHELVKKVKVVLSLDGLIPIRWISSTPVGNAFNVVMAFKKANMRFDNAGSFFYVGTITNPAWVVTNVAVSDTNWLIVGNSLVAPNASESGKYIAVRMTLTPGPYEMGVGRLVGNQQNWGYFGTEYSDSTGKVHFSVLSDGTVVPSMIPSLPGTLGDEGSAAVLRFLMKDSSVVIYSNNLQPFGTISPFVVKYDTNGVVGSPVLESAVTNYPNWGSIEITYRSLPTNRMLVFNFGPRSSQVATFSSNRSQSGYWDAFEQKLKVIIATTPSASGRPVWGIQKVQRSL